MTISWEVFKEQYLSRSEQSKESVKVYQMQFMKGKIIDD